MAFATLDIQVNDKHFVMMLCEILSLSLSGSVVSMLQADRCRDSSPSPSDGDKTRVLIGPCHRAISSGGSEEEN